MKRKLLVLMIIFASFTAYGQDADSIRAKFVADSIARAATIKKPPLIIPMSINANPPVGSIAVNRDPVHKIKTPQQLIQELFVKTGSCATVDNVTVKVLGWSGTAWTGGDTRGLAYFNQNGSTFPIEEGLVLSTGDVRDVEGSNASQSTLGGGSTYMNDPDLAGLIPGYIQTNFTSIEFDFVPTAYVMEFKYIFASEEYPEYVNSIYNDAFGFFINQVSPSVGPKSNIALLPTSLTGDFRVKINNVNDGGWNDNHWTTQGGTAGYLPVSNPAYFVRNLGGSAVMELDGRTTVLTATYNVTPCNKYHLKLAVGNAGDQALGSVVFLQARSFDVGQDLEFSGNAISGNEFIFKDCQNNYYDISRTIKTNEAAVIQVNYTPTGGAVNGVHYTDPYGATLPTDIHFAAGQTTQQIGIRATAAATPGSYFDITMLCPCEGSTAAIVKRIYIYDFVQSFNAGVSSSCSGGNNGKITVTASGGSGDYEFKNGTGAWQSSNVFSGLSAGTYTIYIRDRGTCNPIDVSQPVTVTNIAANAGTDQTNCTGANTFTLAGSQPGVGESGTWTRISGGTVSFANANLYNTTATLTGTTATLRWTRYNSDNSCSAYDDVIIAIGATPAAPAVTTPVTYCLGATASPLSATPGAGFTLRWYDASDVFTGTSAPTPSTATAGITVYKVSRVQTSTTCESAKATITVTVLPLPTATISGPAVACDEGAITLTLSLNGTSPWTINYTERDLVTLTNVPKSTTSTTATKTVTATPFHTSEYIVTQVTDGAGCINTATSSTTVQIQPCGFKYPMFIWLKANDGVQPPSTKFEWLDRSQAMNIDEEAHKDSPFTNIVLQQSVINFNPAVQFNGTTGQFLSGKVLNDYGFSVKSTFFTVTDMKPASSASFPQGVFSSNNLTTRGQGMFINKPGATPFYVMGGTDLSGNYSLSNSGSTMMSYPILLTAMHPLDSIYSTNSKLWENGVLKGTKTGANFNTYPAVPQNFDVGGDGITPANVFDGKIAEIIYFHGALPTNEADKVESYLATKYGIALQKNYLASDGTTITYNYATNPTFRYHIAGIGRDNGFALDQRISHNTSPGDIVTVASNPTAFVTDQSLAPSISADKSYLLWASNNDTKVYATAGIYAGHSLRILNRKWRVNKTGTVGNVSIQFDTTGINIPAGWSIKPALAVSPNANFSSTVTLYAEASGYAMPTYLNVNLPDAYHFTLVLTPGVTSNAGPDQSVCSNDPNYEFTMAANLPGTDESGTWEMVSEPSPGTLTIVNPNLNTTKVKLSVPGTARLRWIVKNTFSNNADTSFVNVSRYALPITPADMTMPTVCSGVNNDSIVINPSNADYLYTVYPVAIGGTAITAANGNGGKLTIKPGNNIVSSTCYYLEIKDTATKCVAPARWQICIPVHAVIIHPDIRFKVCPNPAYTLNLRNYLNTADLVSSSFSYPLNPSLLIGGYMINTGNLHHETLSMTYSVTGHCGTQSARLYIKALDTNQELPLPREVTICASMPDAKYIQLQQIMGMDVSGGVWSFDATLAPITDYITTSVNGEYMFDAQKAWLDGKGAIVGATRHFTFYYAINGSMCIPNSLHELKIILTY